MRYARPRGQAASPRFPRCLTAAARAATRISPDGDLAASSGATAHLVLAATDTRGATHRDPPSFRLAGWRRLGRTSANGQRRILSLFAWHVRHLAASGLTSSLPSGTGLPQSTQTP